MSNRPPAAQSQFKSLRASSLYCNKCKNAMPVRERLLLVLPDKEIYDYLCTGCASSVGAARGDQRGEADDGGVATPPRRRAVRRRCCCRSWTF